jgi:nitroreductase
MILSEIIRKNRSFRRFHQEPKVGDETLRELVDLTRYCPSAANLQPLKYILSSDPERNARIFANLTWAAYLKDWKGPKETERPTGYVIVLQDTNISQAVDCDHGIACQTMLLGATEKGLGGCMLGAVNRKGLRAALNIPQHLKVLLVVAFGKPMETVVVELVGSDGSIKYWRDENDVHHVPKRALSDVILT